MLNAIQNASIASKVCAFHAPPTSTPLLTVSSTIGFASKALRTETLLYLATAGGAAVCGLEKQVGTFAPGKSFDALFVNIRDAAGNPGIWGLADADSHVVGAKSIEEKKVILDGWLERFFFCGDDRNIDKVYVQGRLVGGRTYGRS
jgi:guanine deaminase